MTSPIPYTGYDFHELEAAINNVEEKYPNSPIYFIGTSLGGNYVLRYLLAHKIEKIKAFACLSAPFDVIDTIDKMNRIYQKYFVKSFI